MPFAQPTPAQLAREASTDEKSTQSNWRDAQATHAAIEWRVDFRSETLNGPVTYDVTNKNNASTFVVDTHSGLTIHKAYVDNGNKLLSGTEWENKSLEDIIKGNYDSSKVAQNGIFNNVSQHWNHTQFWEMMGPTNNNMPSELEKTLTDQFGSIDNFKSAFCDSCATQFGSGWCWLVKENDGSLKITKTENGVNPVCFNQTALLGCDVWEHSYYIDFRNKRPAYLENFLNKLVNWENVASRM